ncbi:MAG: ester cyclase [Cyanobacteria bacterium J06636_16]
MEELVISFFERVYNRKDFDYVMEIHAEDYYENTATGARSNQDCRDIIKKTCLIFPDLHVEVNEILAKNEIAAVRPTFTGTHKDTFFGLAATNKIITFEAMEFFRIVDGLIIESWGNWPIFYILERLKT